MDPKTLAALGQILQMREYMRNQQPFNAALATAQQRYPLLKSIPMALTAGVGPFGSETYEPKDDQNPVPGKWTVQLRNDALNKPSTWPSILGLESLHALQGDDPKYQAITQQFVNSMTPEQLKDAHGAYQRDQQHAQAVGDNPEPFNRWLTRVQAQEYIRGMMFPDVIKGWTGPNGEGRYTPLQLKLGKQVQQYLATPK